MVYTGTMSNLNGMLFFFFALLSIVSRAEKTKSLE